IDINIDNIIQNLGETPLASSMRARILVSQSLMYLRLAKRPAARVAIQEYDRLVIEADLKLNTPTNELAFLGAVTALICLEDMTKLNNIFNKQIEFSLRTTTDQRMRAYRLIAGEQARVGMSVKAMTLVQKIQNPIERVRAYQLIIAHTARHAKAKPEEPSLFLPPIEGPWQPLSEPVATQQIINDILKQITDSEEIEEQIHLLTMLVESRLMCDPAIHRLLRECVTNHASIDEMVKQPILQHLNEPRSELIRASLNLPPLPKRLQQTLDPVLDDWNSPTGTLAIGVNEIEPALLNGLIDQQKIRAWLMTSQCYQMCNRHSDAVQVLRKAAAIAREQSQSNDRIQTLLKIGEHFFSVGSISDARTVLRDIGLPSVPAATTAAVAENSNEPVQPVMVFTPEFLSNLARLQIVGRFFEDALKTIDCIEPKSSRNSDLSFLAVEQIRIGRFEEASKTITTITDASQVEKLQHLLAIAQGGGEEHYLAVRIPFPGNLRDAEELRRCCELLIQNGLFGVAVSTAEKINDPELQSRNLARLAREYLLLFKAYGEENDWYRSVREFLLETAYSTAGKIARPALRAEVLEAILTAVLSSAYKENRREFLLRLFEEAFAACRQIDAVEEKVELMGRLILSKIALEVNNRTPSGWPLLNRELNPVIAETIDKLITEAVAVVNEVDDVPQRGYALSFLAKALGQIGRFQGARTFVTNTEETAGNLIDKRESISILLSLIPTLQSLGDTDLIHKIYSLTFTIISDSFLTIPNSAEAMMERNIRDSELDRVVRSMLEQNFIPEAVVFANRINEPLFRDRLFRAAAYIYMDQGNFVSAENVVRRIELANIQTAALRDVLFMKRRANSKPDKSEPADETKITSETITPTL
ncbi:MAG: hypothetical protein LBQ50_01870, partial [Planctomycetaceae bacterium]|nr:hypothetical protein [Planctomycetaceae bacterium]